MKNYVIYEDEEKRVEILGFAHKYFKETIIKDVKATKETYNFLLSLVLTDIKDKVPLSKIAKKEVGITMCHQIPILQPYKGLGFKEPFDVFEDAFEFLSLVPDIKEGSDELLDSIKEHYTNEEELSQKGELEGRIYSKPYKDIAGYFCFITKTELYVLFYGYENIENEDNEIYL